MHRALLAAIVAVLLLPRTSAVPLELDVERDSGLEHTELHLNPQHAVVSGRFEALSVRSNELVPRARCSIVAGSASVAGSIIVRHMSELQWE